MVSKSFEGKVCVRHSLKVLVCQPVRLARLHHGPQPDRNVHHVNEYDQVSDLLPTYSIINMGCAWHHFSLDICRRCFFNLTRCSSFERVSQYFRQHGYRNNFVVYWLFSCLCFTRRRWLCDFPPKWPRVAFGLPYLLIELFYIGMLVVRKDGLSGERAVYGHVITKFSYG